MASDKPLPDADDDIIDLTDLVEEGGAGNGAADADGVDMSFEQELDDLFGDAEPLPAKTPPPPTPAPADGDGEDELFDLAGFEADDEPKPAAAKAAPAAPDGEDDLFDLTGFEADDAPKAPAAAADDDAIDLSGFGLDDEGDDALAGLGSDDDKPAPPAAAFGDADEGDDALDLSGLGLDDDAAPQADASPDISDVSFDDLGPGDAAKTPDAADSLDDIDFSDLDAEPPASAPDSDEPMDLADLDFETATPEAAAAGQPEAVAAVLADIDDDEAPKAVSDADIDALLAEPGDDEPLPDLLGALPDVPEDDDALAAFDAAPDKPAPRDSLPEADDLTDFAELPDVDEPPAEAIPLAAAVAVGAAAIPAMAARAQAGPSVGGIDLGALDNLIDSSKAPAVENDAPAPDKALAGRIAALEAAAAELAGRLDALPPPPDENALAVALAGRLESALTLRVESLLAKYEPAPDAAGLKDDILAEVRASLEDHRAALLAELPPAAPAAALSDDLGTALERLRESLARLEALGQGRHTQFEDFARTMETNLAELRRELPDPEDFVTGKRLAEALDGLGETIAADLAASLDERFDAVAEAARQAAVAEIQNLDARFDAVAESARQEVQTLAASLDERLDAVAEAARQAAVAEIQNLDARFDAVAESAAAAARQEAYTLAQALEPRFAGLENERIDPDALAAKLRKTLLADVAPANALDSLAAAVDQAAKDARDALDGRVTPGDLDAALNTLRASLLAELETAVPKAAAAVIREEIAVLLQEFAD